MKKKIIQCFLLFMLMTTPVTIYASEPSDVPSEFEVDNSSVPVSKSVFYTKENGIEVAEAYNEYNKEELERNKLIGTKCFTNTEDYIEIKSEASESSDSIGKMYSDSLGEIINVQDEWIQIKSGSIENGWIPKDSLITGEEAESKANEVGVTYAKVNTTTLKVRTEASADATVLGLVPKDEELVVQEQADGWVKISIEEGDGWVSTDYVDIWTEYQYAESAEEEAARLAEEEAEREDAAKRAEAAREEYRKETKTSTSENSSENTQMTLSSGSSNGQAVIDYATQFVGNPYVWGGSSLTNGTDCSGFVMSVYANFGISLPHSSTALRSVGYEVSYADAQPGDIICYSGHVALYCGDGTIVHASTAATGIKYSSATYNTILCVRRIF